MGAYYTPRRLRELTDAWSALDCLSESVTTARGLLRAGPTPAEPNVQRRGLVGDQRMWSCVMVDVERAWRSLPDGSLEHDAVLHRLLGVGIDAIAIGARVPIGRVIRALDNAFVAMARFLEGEDAIDEPMHDYDLYTAPTGTWCKETCDMSAPVRE